MTNRKPKPPDPRQRYRVLTWDTDRNAFTPQGGVSEIVVGLAGLRAAVKKLRALGYEANRDDMAVLIEETTRHA